MSQIVSVDVKTDIVEGLKKLYFLEPRQMPFIASLTINRCLQHAKEAVRNEIKQKVRTPRPYTVNGVMMRPSDKTNLRGSVELKNGFGSRHGAGDYLAPLVYGGGRSVKRMERSLKLANMMPASMWMVQTGYCPKDAYGDPKGSYVTAMLSGLRASSDAMQNRTERSARRDSRRRRPKLRDWFVITTKSGAANPRGLPMGVYERKRGQPPMMVFQFVDRVKYRKTLMFFEVAQAAVRQNLQAEFLKAVETAKRTSREGGAISVSAFAKAFGSTGL